MTDPIRQRRHDHDNPREAARWVRPAPAHTRLDLPPPPLDPAVFSALSVSPTSVHPVRPQGLPPLGTLPRSFTHRDQAACRPTRLLRPRNSPIRLGNRP